MEINLNNPDEFTLESVRKLIWSGDDSVNTQFRVTKDGVLFLSKTVGTNELEDIKFRLETNVAGNGYVGESAAEHDGWVTRVYNAIKKAWERGTSGYIDVF